MAHRWLSTTSKNINLLEKGGKFWWRPELSFSSKKVEAIVPVLVYYSGRTSANGWWRAETGYGFYTSINPIDLTSILKQKHL